MICATCATETDDTPCVGCGNDALLVGKYRLERILGQGAQGTTFLATGPHGVCAVKELQLGREAGGKATELFHREAMVLAQLSHPRIPDLYDHFVDGLGVARSLYVVQQFVSGTNLEQRLQSHRFTESEVRDILDQVGAILTYLHTLSPPVIHRDIKPSNLIVDDDSHVHLIDFGAVRHVMRDTVGGGSTVAGTFGYMAPEQLVGDATAQSDLYALGMTAIRLLTREHPTALADRSGTVNWRSRTRVSEPFAAWLDALVSVDPELRPRRATFDDDSPHKTGLAAEPDLRSMAPATTAPKPFLHLLFGGHITDETLQVDRRLGPDDLERMSQHIRQHIRSAGPVSFVQQPVDGVSSDPSRLTNAQYWWATVRNGGTDLTITCTVAAEWSQVRISQRHPSGWTGPIVTLTVLSLIACVGLRTAAARALIIGLVTCTVLLGFRVQRMRRDSRRARDSALQLVDSLASLLNVSAIGTAR